MNRKIFLPVFSLAAICALAACGADAPAQKSPPTVVYCQVEPERLELSRELPGRVSARRMAEVRPQAGGILRERLFEEGDEVARGQLLYRIDDAPLRAAHNEAKAALARAQSREEAARRHMERCIALAKNRAVRLQERDDAIAAYREVEAEIAAARELVEKASIELGYTDIRAPISGQIGRSIVREGALLSESQPEPLAVINQLDAVYVDVSLPAAELLSLKRKQSHENSRQPVLADVIIDDAWHADSEGAVRLQCEIMFSEAQADEATGTVLTRLKCDNSDRLLLPGMFVRASLPLATLEQAIAVPQRSVGRDKRNRPVAYVLMPQGDGIYMLEERQLELQGEHRGRWLISNGLKPGELLLLEGLQKARNGLLVRGAPQGRKER